MSNPRIDPKNQPAGSSRAQDYGEFDEDNRGGECAPKRDGDGSVITQNNDPGKPSPTKTNPKK